MSVLLTMTTGNFFFGVKLFYATFITRNQFTACCRSSRAPGKFKSGGGPPRGHETCADKSGKGPLDEPLMQRLADRSGLGVERTSPLGTERHRTEPAEREYDMIEALHSPGVLYGRATATILHRERSPASLPPQSLPRAFQAKAVGGSLNSKLKFLHSAVSK